MIKTIDETNPAGAPWVRPLVYVAAAAMAVQAVHFIEHLLQLGYWALNPTQAPWLTPWAAAGRDGLTPGTNTALGNEFLHLVGNSLFMAGLVAMVVLSRLTRQPRARQSGRLTSAVTIQGFHLAEHVLLTLSVLAVGKPLGFSTLFGLASGPVGSSYRIWFHFAINLAVTVLGVIAVKGLFGRVLTPRGSGRQYQPA
jgi:hypothetical protein